MNHEDCKVGDEVVWNLGGGVGDLRRGVIIGVNPGTGRMGVRVRYQLDGDDSPAEAVLDAHHLRPRSIVDKLSDLA